MPREDAFDFSYFDEVSAIEFAYDPRRPMLIQLGKFIGEIDFLNYGGCSQCRALVASGAAVGG